MAFWLAGHKQFEDFAIVAAKAGNADGYSCATKAHCLGVYFCGKLPTTHFPWHIV